LSFWWLRTPTSHALLYGSIAFIILFLGVPQSSFRQLFFQFAGILLMIIGFGFLLGVFLFPKWMKQTLALKKEIAILVFLIHLGAGFAGVYFLREGFSQTSGMLLPFLVALSYIVAIGIGFIRK